MENQVFSQEFYERVLVYHVFVLIKTMEQYRRWGKRALSSEILRSDPQYEIAMGRLLAPLKLCAQAFQNPPQPPGGGLEANQVVRLLGEQAGQFAECLEAADRSTDEAEREELVRALAIKSKEIKESYRQFEAIYHQLFPGRLDQMLQTIRADEGTAF